MKKTKNAMKSGRKKRKVFSKNNAKKRLLFAPFKIITAHTKASFKSEERKKVASQSIVSDILGADPVSIPSAGKPKYVSDFLYVTLIYMRHITGLTIFEL
jgi:hypothetical protein